MQPWNDALIFSELKIIVFLSKQILSCAKALIKPQLDSGFDLLVLTIIAFKLVPTTPVVQTL